jgi:RNase P protein component
MTLIMEGPSFLHVVNVGPRKLSFDMLKCMHVDDQSAQNTALHLQMSRQNASTAVKRNLLQSANAHGPLALQGL